MGSGSHEGATRAWILDTRVAYSISGVIELRDYGGDVTQVPIDVELRGDTGVRTETLYTDASGNYTISDVEPGTYDLAFKASHWLRVVVQDVEVGNADVTGIDVSLTNGCSTQEKKGIVANTHQGFRNKGNPFLVVHDTYQGGNNPCEQEVHWRCSCY